VFIVSGAGWIQTQSVLDR